jgi:hypothetical protein
MGNDDRVVKVLLKLLSSDQPGEVLAFASKFKQYLTEAGLDIHSFADAVGGLISLGALQHELSSEEFTHLARDCWRLRDRIRNEGDQRFVHSVYFFKAKLNPATIQRLAEIHFRVHKDEKRKDDDDIPF